ncbi:probable G-protein coupled receptor 149 [Ptychodera flava]|uniref:probable G-protein coupled receptor 149 n=1 Tax=Ptychodera flava TaxID=63121 RepID=UPI003969D7F0
MDCVDVSGNISGTSPRNCRHLVTAIMNSTNATANSSDGVPSDGDVVADMLTVAVLVVAGIVGNLANLLTLSTIFRFKSLSVPDVWIFSLALSDYIFTMVTVPISVYDLLTASTLFTWLCSAFAFSSVWLRLSATATVTMMTLDRYLALRKPILYRTRFTIFSAKRLTIVIWSVSAVLAAFPFANWSSFVHSHGYCIFDYNSSYAVFILLVSFTQFVTVLYTYTEFIFSIRKFVERRQMSRTQKLSSISGKRVGNTSVVLRRLRSLRERGTGSGFGEESSSVVQSAMMNSYNVNKCTRMAKTVALIVALYYVTWSVLLTGITYELIEGRPNEMLKTIGVRVVLLNAILNPMIYAAVCNNYRRGYNKILYNVVCICGCKIHELPLGMTGSQVHRIAQHIVSATDNSPGLNRRMYSKRGGKDSSNSPELQRATSYENPTLVYSPVEEGERPPDDAEKQSTSEVPASENAITVHVETTVSRGSSPAPSRTEVLVHAEHQQIENQNGDKAEKTKQSKACQSHFVHTESVQSDSGCDVESVLLESLSSAGSHEFVSGVHLTEENEENLLKQLGTRNIEFCAIQESVTIKTPVGKTMSLSETYELTSRNKKRTPIAKKVELFSCKSVGDEPSLLKTPQVRIELEVLEICDDNIDTCSLKSNISQSSSLDVSARSPRLRFSTRANRFVSNDMEETETFSMNFTNDSDGKLRTVKVPAETNRKSPKKSESKNSAPVSYQEEIMKLNDYILQRDNGEGLSKIDENESSAEKG